MCAQKVLNNDKREKAGKMNQNKLVQTLQFFNAMPPRDDVQRQDRG